MGKRAVAVSCFGLTLVAGCRDDFNGNDAGSTSGGDGENMLGNPSFELWLEDTVQVWDPESATLTKSDDAFDGQASVRIESPSYASIGQPVTAGLPLETGTCLRIGASVKWVSGSAKAPAFLLNVTYDDESEDLLGEELQWVADGEWHDSAHLVQVPATVTSIAVSIGSTSADPHAYLLDAALMYVDDCG